MTAKEQLDSHSFLFLLEIHEPEESCLRLVVGEGKVIGPPEDVEIAGHVISDTQPVGIAADSAMYELIFPNYILYSVRNESFTTPDQEERFMGHRFRIYSRSKFLCYLKSSTFADDAHPGPHTHYGIVTENHVIDVALCDEPIIRRLEPHRTSA